MNTEKKHTYVIQGIPIKEYYYITGKLREKLGMSKMTRKSYYFVDIIKMNFKKRAELTAIITEDEVEKMIIETKEKSIFKKISKIILDCIKEGI